MQDAKRIVDELVETRAEALLAERSRVPCPGRLRVRGHREDELAEPAVLAVNALLSAYVAALVLTSRRGARHAGIDRGRQLVGCAARLLP
jgi:hypothetical protein